MVWPHGAAPLSSEERPCPTGSGRIRYPPVPSGVPPAPRLTAPPHATVTVRPLTDTPPQAIGTDPTHPERT